ncbi:hypothetical protein HELRODRAFT_78112, partial [Helobdella robusta]|uniref:TsaA-like domain-containing protein n=1 Tax=Helobdella robusta TaxID=6412 RepID=T1G380_HELRO
IGHIESIFKRKNATPRQGSITNFSSSKLIISKSAFNNPEHSLDGLHLFSHIWIIFIFHKNGKRFCGAKVHPPRLDGKSTGVFASRSPHRPNPIGLTLAKISKIEASIESIKQAIIDVLSSDPRSSYRRNRCKDKLYYFTIDNVHVTCWFDDDITSNNSNNNNNNDDGYEKCVEVLRIVDVV